MFSSLSCGRGNAGQSNYGYANSAMERIIEKRSFDKLAGKAIQWGPIGEVGLSVLMTTNDVDVEIVGITTQRISSCLNEMDTLLSTPDPIVSSMVVAKKHDLTISGIKKQQSLIEMMLSIMSIQNINSISMTTILGDLGLDSLITIEIKQTLEREFNIKMTSKDVRNLTFQTLHTLSDASSTAAKSIVSKSDTQESFNLKNILLTETCDNKNMIYRLMSKYTANEIKERVLIFPGSEGNFSSIWRWVCNQITVPTFIANYKSTSAKQTIVEMANMYAKVCFIF